MIKERLQEEVGKMFKPALGFGVSPEGKSLEQHLKDGSLTQERLLQFLKTQVMSSPE